MPLWPLRFKPKPQLPRVVVAPDETAPSTPTVCEKSAQSSVTALEVSPGIGWGKVVSSGKSLGVTFGTPSSRDELGTSASGSSQKLQAIRKVMKDQPEPIDYYIIPSEDAHQSEYVSQADARREYISNFSGSAGLAIVALDSAHLFVDSRYWIQAAKEIDDSWTLHRVGAPGERSWLDWIRHESTPNVLFGVDSRLISCDTAVALHAAVLERNSRLTFPRLNLVDASRPDRPVRPNNPVFVHDIKYTGEASSDKIQRIRAWIREKRPTPSEIVAFPEALTLEGLESRSKETLGLSISTTTAVDRDDSPTPEPYGIVLSKLDSIAWTLNLRGSDVPYNPVFFSYLVITLDEVILFVDSNKELVSPVNRYLDDLGVSRRDYSSLWTYLRKGDIKGQLIIDSKSPYAIAVLLKRPRYVVLNQCIVTQLKGIKNPIEIQGFRECYLRDGAAFVQWLAWLEETVRKKKQPVTEWGAAQKLTEFRASMDNFMGLAYANISAVGPNAALPHYEPTPTGSSLIDTTQPYLNDSGGQYLDGTCDTTRTVHFGQPNQEQQDAYTRVLQGHIAIDSAVFPEGTTGAQLDVLARKALWKDRLNYGHGTGHGFGSFLSVHEGPHAFSNTVPLKPGAVITNEPGFYKEGSFGIRIESALVVKTVRVKDPQGAEVNWLAFERFTHVPIQTSRLVNYSLLSKDERRWLRNHNRTCREKLTPLLQGDKRALKWLRRATSKFGPIEIIWE
ncbi:hypothetical protein FS837_009508 [Tulasnella sp. UAMH 9824]|nr:hypothetical protein FS837_009508 [Tulasnella sp. UAMH 9824]